MQKNYLFFQEFSRSFPGIPGVFQEFQEFSRNSRSFPGIQGVFQKFKEFSRNSRSSEHHVSRIKILSFQKLLYESCEGQICNKIKFQVCI